MTISSDKNTIHVIHQIYNPCGIRLCHNKIQEINGGNDTLNLMAWTHINNSKPPSRDNDSVNGLSRFQ